MKRIGMGRWILLSWFFTLSAHLSFGQVGSLDVGVRFQKTLNMYNENGLTGQYQLSRRVGLGFTYITSRLGSALSSNAIKQDNLLASATWFFRPDRTVRPFLRGNVGYFMADYEAEIFDALPNTSPLLSLDVGLATPISGPIGAAASLGYNIITGDGFEGPGTLFPLFYQLSVTYRLARP